MRKTSLIAEPKNGVREDLIFDIGAHKGEDSDFYVKLGYRVVAVEANPSLTNTLRERFRSAIEDHRFTLVDKAISDQQGKIDFYINKTKTVWGTAHSDWAERNRQMGAESEKITVDSVKFLDIVNQYGCPYYLKIDIEGQDLSCVESLQNTMLRPKYISIEAEKVSWPQLLRTFKAFKALGYDRFQIVDQGKHRSAAFESLDGGCFLYSFESDSSGPFGKYLGKKWLTEAQAIRKFIPIFIGYKTMGDNTKIAGALRRIPIVRRILNVIHWHDIHASRA